MVNGGRPDVKVVGSVRRPADGAEAAETSHDQQNATGGFIQDSSADQTLKTDFFFLLTSPQRTESLTDQSRAEVCQSPPTSDVLRPRAAERESASDPRRRQELVK